MKYEKPNQTARGNAGKLSLPSELSGARRPSSVIVSRNSPYLRRSPVRINRQSFASDELPIFGSEIVLRSAVSAQRESAATSARGSFITGQRATAASSIVSLSKTSAEIKQKRFGYSTTIQTRKRRANQRPEGTPVNRRFLRNCLVPVVPHP